MRRIYLFLAVFLGLPALALAQGAVAAPAAAPKLSPSEAPKIYFPHPTFDFGNVDEGPDIVHLFYFRNRGKSTLQIKNVSTSCGCTAAVENKKLIPAGGRGIIKATYHTNGRPGHATKFITVSTNDPADPNYQLRLDMTVVRDVDVQPDRLYLYGIRHGTAKDSTINIMGKPGVPLHILSANATSGVVTVTSVTPYGPDSEKRSGATLQVLLPGTQPIGNFTDNIVVKTDSPKKPEVDIQVLGQITGPIQVNPQSLYFAPHQEQPVTVTLTPLDNPDNFIVRSVSSEKGLVRPYVRQSNTDGRAQYEVVVSVIKNIPKDSDGKDEVLVNTNVPEQRQIKIDVQASK